MTEVPQIRSYQVRWRRSSSNVAQVAASRIIDTAQIFHSAPHQGNAKAGKFTHLRTDLPAARTKPTFRPSFSIVFAPIIHLPGVLCHREASRAAL